MSLFTEQYRPKTVSECILPKDLQKTFQSFVDKKSIPNLLLVGPPGIGKTSIAKAMCNEIDCNYMLKNASLYGNIDTLRHDISKFARTVSFKGGRKYVILDEADHMNPQSTMPALRGFMEQFADNCGFILTCNYKNKIIDPLISRCSVVEFQIPKGEKPQLMEKSYKLAKRIAEENNIVVKDEVLQQLVVTLFPDIRQIINQVQKGAQLGELNGSIIGALREKLDPVLIKAIKEKSFDTARKWIVEHNDIDSTVLYRMLYDGLLPKVTEQSVGELVVILARYQYQNAFVADKEINNVACVVELMMELAFK